jgi:hypothetical protein
MRLHALIKSDSLLGPHFLPRRLTGDVYHNFIGNILPDCKDLDLQNEIHLWFMNNGAQPHLWFIHCGAQPHLWFMNNGAQPHLWFMNKGAQPHLCLCIVVLNHIYGS